MDQQQQQPHELTFQQEFRLIHRLKATRYVINIVIQFSIDQKSECNLQSVRFWDFDDGDDYEDVAMEEGDVTWWRWLPFLWQT